MGKPFSALLIVGLLLFVAFSCGDIVPYEELTVKPRVIKRVEPQFPLQARKNHWSGKVVIKAVLDETGKVTRCTVLESSGHKALDDAAIQAIMQWKYSPGKKDGKAVKTWVPVPITFRFLEKK